MNYLEHFKIWLKSKRYNPGTIRNYLCDINKYIRYTHNHAYHLSADSSYIFSDIAFKNYVLYINHQKNRLRYLTSLAKLSQFAYEKNIISQNSFRLVRKQILRHQNTQYDPLLQMYHNTLKYQKKTPATIKNYLNDIQQFVNWSQPYKDGHQ
jgi:site-specific recombinase XerD